VESDVTHCNFKDRYDYILHLASRASPEDYQRYPIETLLANSLGSYQMLELARKFDARILFASSSEVYGDAKDVPTVESYWGNVNPIGLRSCYDVGKRFGEALFMAYYRNYGVDTRIVRIFNTYGPRLRADGPYGRVLSRFILQALCGQDITVYGNGMQTRSFCYVSDTSTAILKMLTTKELQGEVINVGNPVETTIWKLATLVKEVTNSDSKIVFYPSPPDDPKRRCPDINKAVQLLGWRPLVRLEEGLNRTISWFRKTLKK
jgi:UDP-glucuronate decarboxylase